MVLASVRCKKKKILAHTHRHSWLLKYMLKQGYCIIINYVVLMYCVIIIHTYTTYLIETLEVDCNPQSFDHYNKWRWIKFPSLISKSNLKTCPNYLQRPDKSISTQSFNMPLYQHFRAFPNLLSIGTQICLMKSQHVL